jgi:hypothetical protein
VQWSRPSLVIRQALESVGTNQEELRPRTVEAEGSWPAPCLAGFPLKPFRYYRLRRPYGAPRWLRGSRGGVLRGAARVDRPPGRGAMERSSFACSIHAPVSSYASMCGHRAAGTASRTPIARDARRRRRSHCSRRYARRPIGQHQLRSHSSSRTAQRASVAFSASLRWRRNTAQRSSRRPRRPRSTWACPPIASCAVTSNADPRCR